MTSFGLLTVIVAAIVVAIVAAARWKTVLAFLLGGVLTATILTTFFVIVPVPYFSATGPAIVDTAKPVMAAAPTATVAPTFTITLTPTNTVRPTNTVVVTSTATVPATNTVRPTSTIQPTETVAVVAMTETATGPAAPTQTATVANVVMAPSPTVDSSTQGVTCYDHTLSPDEVYWLVPCLRVKGDMVVYTGPDTMGSPPATPDFDHLSSDWLRVFGDEGNIGDILNCPQGCWVYAKYGGNASPLDWATLETEMKTSGCDLNQGCEYVHKCVWAPSIGLQCDNSSMPPPAATNPGTVAQVPVAPAPVNVTGAPISTSTPPMAPPPATSAPSAPAATSTAVCARPMSIFAGDLAYYMIPAGSVISGDIFINSANTGKPTFITDSKDDTGLVSVAETDIWVKGSYGATVYCQTILSETVVDSSLYSGCANSLGCTGGVDYKAIGIKDGKAYNRLIQHFPYVP